ncbi:MAG: NAD(P)-dependent oxidoreductase [Chloroflexota bacterium]|nr:NAD(P)-dependent oxidoreductase [Chloroflexota bacterium]
MSDKKVLVTGLAGKIGGIIRSNLSGKYSLSGLDLEGVPGFPTTTGNLSNLDEILPAFKGIDTVVHLAADPNHQGGWETNLENNIIGTRNVYEAARISGVKRIIFASSNHALGFYPLKDNPYKQIYDGDFEAIRQPIKPLTTDLIRPDGYYGVSKAFGESLGSYFHDEYGISVICMRIGWVMEPDDPTFAPSALSLWMSHKDTVRLIDSCIDAPESVGFAIVYGMSDNTYGIWDMEDGRKIVGYEPNDDAGTTWNRIQGKSSVMKSGDPQV